MATAAARLLQGLSSRLRHARSLRHGFNNIQNGRRYLMTSSYRASSGSKEQEDREMKDREMKDKELKDREMKDREMKDREMKDREMKDRERHRAAVECNFDEDPEKASGKTSVNIVNHQTEEGLFFDAYSPMGFRLSNGTRIIGPCAAFPRSVLHWNVQSIHDVSPASLRLFTILEPKIDILLLGVGERENLSRINTDIVTFLREHRINVELLSTDQALATFNFLNSEKRYVAAALLPPTYSEDERFDTDAIISSRLETDDDVFMMPHDYDHIAPGHEAGITDDMWAQRASRARKNIQVMLGVGQTGRRDHMQAEQRQTRDYDHMQALREQMQAPGKEQTQAPDKEQTEAPDKEQTEAPDKEETGPDTPPPTSEGIHPPTPPPTSEGIHPPTPPPTSEGIHPPTPPPTSEGIHPPTPPPTSEGIHPTLQSTEKGTPTQPPKAADQATPTQPLKAADDGTPRQSPTHIKGPPTQPPADMKGPPTPPPIRKLD